jgi:hypothetical protein
MLKFLAEYHNWLLGFVAACLWFGAVGWYLRPILWKAWMDRYDSYFKNW